MAKILPFRGYRYNPEKIDTISDVISEPYDKITPEMQERYYQKHPRNIVRLIKGKTCPYDNESNNQYSRARDYLEKWIAEGILIRDEQETMYAYSEEYTLADEPPKIRQGFIALGKLEEFGKGGVKPHERTLAGPKADRLNLMRATGAQFGLIFMLYSDLSGEVNGTLAKFCGRAPDIAATDENGVTHRIWRIADRAAIEKVKALMEDKMLFIADGHHRYETALNYRREMREKGVKCLPGNENYDNRMMAFVSMEDSGLTILPTHRLLFNLTGEQVKTFSTRLASFFNVETCTKIGELLEKIKPEKPRDHRFGLYMNGTYSLLVLKDESRVSALVSAEASDEWKRLDVTVLHTLLEHLLGIDREKLEQQTNVAYERYAETAVRMVDEGRYQIALFLNPTKASQVARVAGRGERMPQKSTDFYPKLYTGLVINKLNFEQRS
jgi:uncharacterized protein (DUF1015 family)